MSKNQARVLYALGTWIVGFFIYKLSSLPGGWDAMGESIAYAIGYSSVIAVPVALILLFSFRKKKTDAQSHPAPSTKSGPPGRAAEDAKNLPKIESAEYWYQKALTFDAESQSEARFDCFKRALSIDPDHVRSLCGISAHLMNGSGIEKDVVSASKHLRRAAELGFPLAQDQLGLMYEHGNGVRKDHLLAKTWFLKAADMGYADAQYHLGVLCGNHEGVTRNYIESALWCRRAAEQGHRDAQATLGRIYMEGLDGIPKSTEEAAKWLDKAAENGDAEAQFYLGELFELGDGVVQDLEEAARLYSSAAEQGHEEGQLGVERMNFYLGRHTKSLEPLSGEEDSEFRIRRLVESTRFKPPQKGQ